MPSSLSSSWSRVSRSRLLPSAFSGAGNLLLLQWFGPSAYPGNENTPRARPAAAVGQFQEVCACFLFGSEEMNVLRADGSRFARRPSCQIHFYGGSGERPRRDEAPYGALRVGMVQLQLEGGYMTVSDRNYGSPVLSELGVYDLANTQASPTSWRPGSESGLSTFQNPPAEKPLDSSSRLEARSPSSDAHSPPGQREIVVRGPSRTTPTSDPRRFLSSPGKAHRPAMQRTSIPIHIHRQQNHPRDPFRAGSSSPALLLASVADGNPPTTATALHAARIPEGHRWLSHSTVWALRHPDKNANAGSMAVARRGYATRNIPWESKKLWRVREEKPPDCMGISQDSN
ncbi:hypothetical protein V8D89_002448 [Ganoderma adspersum]